MVPAIRNILGGFLFSGDDVYKKAGVLSGGERTRLAVARMLLRPSNTLLLDEPTNHLDLDSKDVLLDALEDYGGTLIIVSHDRYFVEKLATKIIEIGHGEAVVYPGTYAEFLWSKEQTEARLRRPSSDRRSPRPKARGRRTRPQGGKPQDRRQPAKRTRRRPGATDQRQPTREERKRLEAERKKKQRDARNAAEADRRSRGAHRGARGAGQGARSGDVRAGVLRRPRRVEAAHRPAPGADVGGRRPDGASGKRCRNTPPSTSSGIVSLIVGPTQIRRTITESVIDIRLT